MKRAEPTTSLQASQISYLMTAVDVGLILGISTKTVHKLVRERKLSCVQVTARDRRFVRSEHGMMATGERKHYVGHGAPFQ